MQCHEMKCNATARDLDEALEMGIDWSVREGYAWAEDKVCGVWNAECGRRTMEYICML